MPFSLSLNKDSTTVFCLLWVHLEGPKGEWGMMSRDPEEPWAEEVTATKEVPLKEPTGT